MNLHREPRNTTARTATSHLLPPSAGLLLLIGAVSLYADSALADVTAAECAASYEKGQELRRAEKFGAAREQFLVCAQATCPKFMVTDCSQWLGEIEQSLSSVVLTARDAAGRDVTKVRVLLDGAPWVDTLDGRAVELDAGMHTIRFESEGHPPIEQQYAVRQGERNRLIAVQFAASAEEARATPGPSKTEDADRGAAKSASGSRAMMGYGLVGLGAVGVGAFAYFGLSGRSDRNHLESTCAPACSQADVDAAKSKLVVGDVALLAGLVSGGIGAWFLLSGPPVHGPGAQLAIRPSPGGFSAQVSGTFE